jgi:hypothetical protein
VITRAIWSVAKLMQVLLPESTKSASFFLNTLILAVIPEVQNVCTNQRHIFVKGGSTCYSVILKNLT